ncbi:MAG: hypothetical protein MUO54_05035, partial [Anaerolineales bacterium]|nr:hypothetical protein [Anaerolineales bacterium]
MLSAIDLVSNTIIMMLDMVYNHAMVQQFNFDLQGVNGKARAGTFLTPHGLILTPTFAPVGTQAAVKGV